MDPDGFNTRRHSAVTAHSASRKSCGVGSRPDLAVVVLAAVGVRAERRMGGDDDQVNRLVTQRDGDGVGADQAHGASIREGQAPGW